MKLNTLNIPRSCQLGPWQVVNERSPMSHNPDELYLNDSIKDEPINESIVRTFAMEQCMHYFLHIIIVIKSTKVSY